MEDKITKIKIYLIKEKKELVELALKEGTTYNDAIEKLTFHLDKDKYVTEEIKVMLNEVIDEIKLIALKNATK